MSIGGGAVTGRRSAESRFAGETALVTGGSAGIGLEIARGLVRGGARVVLVARGRGRLVRASRELAREAPAECAAQPWQTRAERAIRSRPGSRRPAGVAVEGPVQAYAADVGEAAHVRALARWLARATDRVDVLVNDAGHLEVRPFERLDDSAWERTLAVNLLGPARTLRALLPLLRRSAAPRVLNVSSISGVEGSPKLPGTTAYAASKAALIALTQVLAVEWKETRLRVNAVSYGSVDTAMLRAVPRMVAPGMSPQAAARMALFLASRDSEPMSGRNVEVWS